DGEVDAQRVDRQHLVAGGRDRRQMPQPRPRVAAFALDSVDHLVDVHPLPPIEHLLEQGPAVVEVPVEAALRDAERPRERLDPDRVGPARGEGLQALIDPAVARGSDERHCVPGDYTVSYGWMRVANTEHTSRPWRIREIAGDFRVED